MVRFIKLAIALFLLPTAVLAFAQTVRLVFGVLGHWPAALSFLVGVLVYVIIHFAWYNFSRPYVFVHEMTHALAALLCGCRIKDFSVGKDSGYVKMDKCNAFVVLAPYFLPGYVVLTALVYVIASLFVDLTPYRQGFLFLIGFFTAFHWVQTVKTLFEADQPDLKLAGGKVFSLVMIGLANLLVLALVLKGLFPQEVLLLPAGKNVLVGTLNVWRILVNYIVERVVNAG